MLKRIKANNNYTIQTIEQTFMVFNNQQDNLFELIKAVSQQQQEIMLRTQLQVIKP